MEIYRSWVKVECQTGASSKTCRPKEPVNEIVEQACKSSGRPIGWGMDRVGVVLVDAESGASTVVIGPKCQSLTYSVSKAGHVARW